MNCVHWQPQLPIVRHTAFSDKHQVANGASLYISLLHGAEVNSKRSENPVLAIVLDVVIMYRPRIFNPLTVIEPCVIVHYFFDGATPQIAAVVCLP